MKTLSINRITIAAMAIMFSLVVFSCQKESSLNSDSTTTTDPVTEEDAVTASDESTQAEASFDDVEDVSVTAAEEEGDAAVYGRGDGISTDGIYHPLFNELRVRIGNCATITTVPDNNTYPKTVTIDFGDGCLCADGKFRKGAIVIQLTGPIRHAGSVMTISLQNFYLNNAHIEGSKTYANLSENGNIKFTVQVVGGKVTFPNGRGYAYQSLKYVKQVEGGSTRIVRDDVYKIERTSKTEYNGGLTVTLDTDTPLTKKIACPWITDGTLKIKINSRLFKLDFGAPNNGDCDNKALLTWNDGNKQRLITLP